MSTQYLELTKSDGSVLILQRNGAGHGKVVFNLVCLSSFDKRKDLLRTSPKYIFEAGSGQYSMSYSEVLELRKACDKLLKDNLELS